MSRIETGEYKLKKSLFDNYDTEIRPVLRDETTIQVKFEIALHQILEIVSDSVLESEYVSEFLLFI